MHVADHPSTILFPSIWMVHGRSPRGFQEGALHDVERPGPGLSNRQFPIEPAVREGSTRPSSKRRRLILKRQCARNEPENHPPRRLLCPSGRRCILRLPVSKVASPSTCDQVSAAPEYKS